MSSNTTCDFYQTSRTVRDSLTVKNDLTFINHFKIQLAQVFLKRRFRFGRLKQFIRKLGFVTLSLRLIFRTYLKSQMQLTQLEIRIMYCENYHF